MSHTLTFSFRKKLFQSNITHQIPLLHLA
jgi:hypothetical protein